MSLIKLALNKETFGPVGQNEVLPDNPISERQKPVLNKIKKKPNKTVLNWGMKE